MANPSTAGAPPLDGVALAFGMPGTSWKRAVVDEALAGAAGCAPVWLVLLEGGEPLDDHVASGPASGDPYWRAADRTLDGAAAHLEDIRDESGVLDEVAGPVAPAIGSPKFCRAALARLGAQQAFATTPDGSWLRLRDAWRAHPPADLAALRANAGEGGVWLVDARGVRGVVVGDEVVDASGTRTQVVEGPVGGADRDQLIFARALLAFLGGLVMALGMALALALR